MIKAHRTKVLLLTTTTFIINIKFLQLAEAASKAGPGPYLDYDSCPFPPPNLPCRSQDEFMLTRRLGAGKFSDVFEAVDVGNDLNSNTNDDDNQQTSSSNKEETSSKQDTLCVIKCLKPVSERKIKRELLVLSHVSELPNLARLRGVVIPPTTSNDSQSQQSDLESAAATGNGKRNSNKSKNNSTGGGRQMPSLVLEHAGLNSRWLCHGRGCDASTPASLSTTTTQTETPPLHLTEYEIKYYLFHLLIALDALHSRGIMHRDVKPRNVLINRSWPPPNSSPFLSTTSKFKNNSSSSSNTSEANVNGTTNSRNNTGKGLVVGKGTNNKNDSTENPSPLMLIDLGLADFYLPNQRYNVRVASRHYKSPELLLGYEFYDYGLDMWGVGCILAGLLLRREPFFRGKDNIDQLGKIVAVLGSQDLMEYCDKFGIELTKELEDVVRKYTMRSNFSGRRKSWLTLMGVSNKSRGGGGDNNDNMRNLVIPSKEGIHLLDKLLVYDHETRLTAREAMMHPFFDDVRDFVTLEVKERWNLEQQNNK